MDEIMCAWISRAARTRTVSVLCVRALFSVCSELIEPILEFQCNRLSASEAAAVPSSPVRPGPWRAVRGRDQRSPA